MNEERVAAVKTLDTRFRWLCNGFDGIDPEQRRHEAWCPVGEYALACAKHDEVPR
jgi:hypothetical protein